MWIWLTNRDYTKEFLGWYCFQPNRKLVIDHIVETQWNEEQIVSFRWTAFLKNPEKSWALIKNQLENMYERGTLIFVISMRYIQSEKPFGPEGWPDVIEVRLVNPLKVMKYASGSTAERGEIAKDAILYQLSCIQKEIELLKKLVLHNLSAQPPYEEGRLITEEEANEWYNQATQEG